MKDFCDEMALLKAHKPSYDNNEYDICIRGWINDAPARSFLKGTVSHTGYHSCERCCTEGVWRDHRIILDACVSARRTHQEFASYAYADDDGGECHQKYESALLNFADVDVVNDVIIDSMHLIFLGVVKRFLQFLKNVKGSAARLPNGLITEISLKLTELSGLLPSDFVRQPRSLKFLPYWKATEFRSFLLYSGPVVLKGVVSQKVYDHFLQLSVAIYILHEEDDEWRNRRLDYCQSLLEVYVENCSRYLGDIFCVYNVHNLLHLTDDVRYFNTPLQHISAFPFENFLQTVKRYVKGRRYPLEEIVKRYGESIGKSSRAAKSPVNKVSCTPKDSCFLLQDGLVVLKEKERSGLDQYKCRFYGKHQLSDFYTSPLNSSELGTYYVKNSNVFALRVVSRSDLLRKCVRFPYQNGFVTMTLLHGMN